jgi:hypothetical protein
MSLVVWRTRTVTGAYERRHRAAAREMSRPFPFFATAVRRNADGVRRLRSHACVNARHRRCEGQTAAAGISGVLPGGGCLSPTGRNKADHGGFRRRLAEQARNVYVLHLEYTETSSVLRDHAPRTSGISRGKPVDLDPDAARLSGPCNCGKTGRTSGSDAAKASESTATSYR